MSDIKNTTIADMGAKHICQSLLILKSPRSSSESFNFPIYCKPSWARLYRVWYFLLGHGLRLGFGFLGFRSFGFGLLFGDLVGRQALLVVASELSVDVGG